MPLDLANPYAVELILKLRGEEPARGLFDLQLNDHNESDFESAVIDLGLAAEPLPGDGLTAGRFLELFLADGHLSTADALAFGRLLLARLLSEANLRRWWAAVEERYRVAGRPLRLQAFLPPGHSSRVAEIPLELLADERGFLFRRGGNRLVRSVLRFRPAEAALGKGDRAALAWANPAVGEPARPLDSEVFARHEAHLDRLARALGLHVLSPCRAATLHSLGRYLGEQRPIALLSLIAHGGPSGGSLLLHCDGHPDFPNDPGDPIRARDAARLLREAGVRVALLWSCHGGRHHAAFGAVAEALLDPEHGDVPVVLAAHAALRADVTPLLFEGLVRALAGTAEGDVERALQDARAGLPEDDLQWAAIVYYSRPHSPLLVARPQPAAFEPAPTARAVRLEGSPELARYFVGRDKEVADGLALLRSGRLVTVAGAPGIGKTELAVAIGAAALESANPPFERTLWLSLQGAQSTEALRGQLAAAFGRERCESDEELASAIGATSALLVLDNAEDLLRADAGALRTFAATLLRLCHGVRLLLSSRLLLGPAAGHEEAELRLTPLAPPHDREAFVAAAGPRLRRDERDSPELGELVSMLDGHPLSLVLMASQTGRGLALGDLRRRLERGRADDVVGAELAGLELAPEERAQVSQRSLAASVALSYEPLARQDPAAAEAFCWLGVLPAGLPGALVTPVFGEGGAEAVGSLIRSYLAEKRGRDGRVVLLAPVRLYARGRVVDIPAPRRPRLGTSTFEALASWLEGAYDLLGQGRTRRAADLAFVEQPNLAELVRWAKAEPADGTPSTVGPTIAEGLARTFAAWSRIVSHAGRPSAAVPLITQVADLVGPLATPSAGATLAQALGDLYLRTARLADAERAYLQALPLFQQIEDRLGEANTLLALGDLYRRTDRLADAERAYLQALPLYQRIEDRLGEANTRAGLGQLALARSEPALAFRCFLEALELHRSIEDRLGEGGAHGTSLALRSRPNAQVARSYWAPVPSPCFAKSRTASASASHLTTSPPPFATFRTATASAGRASWRGISLGTWESRPPIPGARPSRGCSAVSTLEPPPRKSASAPSRCSSPRPSRIRRRRSPNAAKTPTRRSTEIGLRRRDLLACAAGSSP